MKKENRWFTVVSVLFLSMIPALAVAQPQVWVTDSLHRTGPTDAAGSGTFVQLSAGRGEYESFQVVVQAGGSALSNVNFSVSDLSGPGGALIPPSAFSLYREHYVYVNQSSPNWGGSNQPLGAGWYPDGLIPFNDPSTGAPITGAALQAVPFNLASSHNQPIWADLLVPRTAAPGAYNGTYTVTSDQGSVTGTISLTVWHFTLPLQPSLHSAFLYWTADSLSSEEELLRNKLAPLKSAPSTQSTLVNNFGLNTVGLPFFSGADVTNCTMSDAPDASVLAAAAAQQAPGLYQLDYSADEIDNCPTLIPTMKKWGKNLHKAGVQNLATMAPNPALYDDGNGNGRSAVDIWTMLPLAYDQNVSQTSVVLKKGDSVWSYNALVQDAYSPKWMIDFAPLNLRVQSGFISQSLGLTGLLYWRIDDWSSDPWNQVNNQGTFSSNNYPGEGMLVYPGAQVGISGVAPSMRLKWLRDGVEDYEYVAMLKAAGQGTYAMGLANSVAPDWTNWTRDTAQLASVRNQMGMALDQLAAPPAVPSSPAPVSAAASVSGTPTLTWGASTGATSYSVFFGTSANPSQVATITGTSFSPGTLTAGTTYFWGVAAVNGNGSSAVTSWSFTTAVAVPTAPVNPSLNGATGVSATPTLTWNASTGATSYSVYLGTSATPAMAATVTGTNFTPTALIAGTTYYWNVAATNAAGSAVSATWSFTTAVAVPAAPVNLSPNSATGVSVNPTLTWTPVPGATSYSVYLGTTTAVSLAATVTGSSYSSANLTAGTVYYWRVAAANAAGSTSSALLSFTTAVALPSAPANPSPNGATGVTTSPTLTWSSAPGAASYNIYMGKTAATTLVATVTGTSYSPAGLTAGTLYYWSVAAVNASGSTVSATWSFTTAVPLPGAVSGFSPASGSTAVAVSPSLAWSASTGATAYGVYFGTTSSPALVATITGTSYSPGTLAAGTTYYWKVVAVNASGSTASATLSFTTAAAAVTAPVTPAPVTPAPVTPAPVTPAPVNVAPVINSVTPTSGLGPQVEFRVGVSDANGSADLSGAGVIVNSSVDGRQACWFFYDHAANTLSLANDTATAWSALIPGSSTTISNSHCAIAGTGVATLSSSTGLMVSVSVTFNAQTFSGSKSVYAIAIDKEGLSTGYLKTGTWSVSQTASRTTLTSHQR